MTDKPSGSFVLWQNTLCNPLADPISMTHSAWHDGHASGVKEERKRIVALLQAQNKHKDRQNFYAYVTKLIEESA